GVDGVVVSDGGDVGPLVSGDVVAGVVGPGATTTGSGIAGGGTPGGSVALASFASTFTVRSCHCVASCSFCPPSFTAPTAVVTACSLSWAACHWPLSISCCTSASCCEASAT